MVSAWACQNRLVLGQRKVDEKSNEITAIPQLLEVLALEGCIVTIDAMGCQKAIAKAISDKQGDYVLALKANQGNLYHDVVQLFEYAQRTGFKDVEYDFYQSSNGGHGRVEVRQHWTMEQVSYLTDAQQWQGFKSIGIVQSQRRIKGRMQTETRYYILSLSSNARRFAEAVRSHWGIENCLHWVLDVAFAEDDCRVRKDHAPENLAIVRHIALNLLNQEKSAKGGIKAKRLKAGWDNHYLSTVLAQ
jgi:predicted transposase YbfD/YdcC